MLIKLITGSTAGHGKTEDYYYDVNVEHSKELWDAYKRGVEICGVDLTKDLCTEYEDNGITIGDLRKLFKHDVIVEDDDIKAYVLGTINDGVAEKAACFDDLDDNDKEFYFFGNGEEFHDVWLEIAKLGNPDLKYRSASRQVVEFNIGGYGLFW